MEFNQANNIEKSNLFDEMISFQYNLDADKGIYFLLDFTKDMLRSNSQDEKMLMWQVEHFKELERFGLSAEKLKTMCTNNNKKYYHFDKMIQHMNCISLT